MAMSVTELRGALESVLFVAGEPVKTEDLVEAFPDAGAEAISAQLEAIRERLDEIQSGLQLELAAGGWRFATRPEYDPFLRRFFAKQGEGRLSVAALETLAIVAYRQPVTAPEISDIRGVNPSGVLRTLSERKLIKIAGRKNVVGSPFLYRTTREFLMHFGLNSIQDLPRLEEFAEILGENLSDELIEAIGGGDGGALGVAGEERDTLDAPETLDASETLQAPVTDGTADPDVSSLESGERLDSPEDVGLAPGDLEDPVVEEFAGAIGGAPESQMDEPMEAMDGAQDSDDRLNRNDG